MQKKTVRIEFLDGKFKSHKDILTMSYTDNLFFQFSDNKGQVWTVPWATIKEIKVSSQAEVVKKPWATINEIKVSIQPDVTKKSVPKKKEERDVKAMSIEDVPKYTPKVVLDEDDVDEVTHVGRFL